MHVADLGRVVGLAVMTFAEHPDVIEMRSIVHAQPLLGIKLRKRECRRIRRMVVHDVAAVLIIEGRGSSRFGRFGSSGQSGRIYSEQPPPTGVTARTAARQTPGD